MKIEMKEADVLLNQEDWECVIDMAGYGVGYWAHKCVPHDGDLSYRVEWYEGNQLNSQIISLFALQKAWGKIIAGKIEVNSDIRNDLSSGDVGDVDATAADVLIQVALFGEIIYG
jgi:hypothetical protein